MSNLHVYQSEVLELRKNVKALLAEIDRQAAEIDRLRAQNDRSFFLGFAFGVSFTIGCVWWLL